MLPAGGSVRWVKVIDSQNDNLLADCRTAQRIDLDNNLSDPNSDLYREGHRHWWVYKEYDKSGAMVSESVLAFHVSVDDLKRQWIETDRPYQDRRNGKGQNRVDIYMYIIDGGDKKEEVVLPIDSFCVDPVPVRLRVACNPNFTESQSLGDLMVRRAYQWMARNEPSRNRRAA